MKIESTTLYGRDGWELNNDRIKLVLLKGGGHIASLKLARGPKTNPLWKPVWRTMDPWNYTEKKHAARYESRLLASICGHNVCLGWFGGASEAEARQGLGPHGEAPVSRWKQVTRKTTRQSISLTVGCELKATGMTLERMLTLRKGSNLVRVRETVRNTLRRDLPYTMCQHVTLAAPFLEKGVTVFDMSATRGHTYPGHFEDRPRLATDREFTWPEAPGRQGRAVDLRTIGAEYKVSSDYSVQLMDPDRDEAWFAALNPKLGLMLAYVWNRSDYPWLGNWEENYGRTNPPWGGKTLARGMEFANTPFPTDLKDQVRRGDFQGQPTFRWLPARGKHVFEYSILLMPVPDNARGVADIRANQKHFAVDLAV